MVNCPRNISAILTGAHWGEGGQSMPEMLSWPQAAQYLTWVSWRTLISRVRPVLEEFSYSALQHENMNVSLMPSSHMLPLKQALINHFSLRYVYLGLTLVLGMVSIFFSVAVLWVLRKRSSPQDETLSANGERGTCGTKIRKDNFVNSDYLIQSSYWPEKETRL